MIVDHQSVLGISGNVSVTGSLTAANSSTSYIIGSAVPNTNASAIYYNGDSSKYHSGLDIKGPLTVNGVDIGKTLKDIQDRLSILVPDPDLLEKYEALKQSYEHYKTLEALVLNDAKKKTE